MNENSSETKRLADAVAGLAVGKLDEFSLTKLTDGFGVIA